LVAGAAQGKSETAVAVAPTANAAAYDFYLKGLHESGGTRFEAARRAIADLEKAVAIDPKFAAAWAELAWHYGFQEQERPGGIGFRKAEVALEERTARRALALDPRSALALSELGAIEDNRGRWAEADGYFRRALAAQPSDFHANQMYSVFLARLGYVQNALVFARRAHQVAPLSGGAMSDLGLMLTANDPRSAAGRMLVDSAVAASPRLLRAHANRLLLHLADGRLDEAIGDQRAMDGLVTDAAAQAFGEGIVARARDPTALKAYLRGATSRAAALDAQGVDLVSWALFIGDSDLAADLLVRSQTERIKAGDRNFLSVLQHHAPLRKDPRIKAMIVRSGLPQYWRAHGWPKICRPVGETDFQCS
jgi:tetratricopeptide (TPR) repeat protein